MFESLEPRIMLDGAPPAPLLVDLQPGSDSGVHSDDNLTNVTTPTVDVTAAQEGDTIRIYRDGLLLGDAAPVSGVLYQYTFAAGQLIEDDNPITARSFDGVEESPDCPILTITLDTTGPRIAAATPDAPVNLRTDTLDSATVTFSEPIDFAPAGGSFSTDDVTITGPEGPIAPTGIIDLGNEQYEVTFTSQTRRGTYVVFVGPEVTDLAGNLMDQDQDGQLGEIEEDIHEFSFSAYDADAVFTTDTHIPVTDTTYDGQDICINGVTVTIDGYHSFNSMHVIEGGIVTHAAESVVGLCVEVSTEVIIGPDGGIVADGKGYGSDRGPGAGSPGGGSRSGGGGGYGGVGGRSQAGKEGGRVYGSITEPSDPGSGGGNGDGPAGGCGGGIIRLSIGGTLWVDGEISADGHPGEGRGGFGSGYYAGGGGSGGSIWIAALALSGMGSIGADGGAAGYAQSWGSNEGGGGGGGRIAIYYHRSSFAGVLSASGGTAIERGEAGGAGTVFTKSSGHSRGDLLISNAGRLGGGTPLVDGAHTFDRVHVEGSAILELSSADALNTDELVVDGSGRLVDGGDVEADLVHLAMGGTFELNQAETISNMVVADGGVLTHAAKQTGFRLTVTGGLTVEPGGTISADGKGYGSDEGPGAGVATGDDLRRGGGAGHGGVGGTGRGGAPDGGDAYGMIAEPTDWGSGGGSGRGTPGGAGGGAIRLSIGGTLRVDGEISADGAGGEGSGGFGYGYFAGGGGSGGSIWIDTPELVGSGYITAKGGQAGYAQDWGSNEGGGGGGGRIAIYCDMDAFSGELSAAGGPLVENTQPGGAGTIFTKRPTQDHGALWLHNAGQAGAPTPLVDGAHTFDSVHVEGSAVLELSSDDTLNTDELVVDTSGRVVDGGDVEAPLVRLVSGGTFELSRADTIPSMVIADGGVLTHPAGQAGCHLTVTGDLTVESGGSISANGKGHAPEIGPGAGQTGSAGITYEGGGGGYGGVGGASIGAGGGVYGLLTEPSDLGSGGGDVGGHGGHGGGALRLTVGGTLYVDGNISADGEPGTGDYLWAWWYSRGGGGSGGSIWIVASQLSGSGNIHANGGQGGEAWYSQGGGGGGGRIAIYYQDASVFNLTGVTAVGGAGDEAGGEGTVVLAGPDAGPIVSSDTAPQGLLRVPVDHVDVVFTRPIEPTTFTAEDAFLWGPEGEIPVTAIEFVREFLGRQTYRMSFPLQETNGRYQVRLGPDIVGLNGKLLDQDWDGIRGEALDDVYEAAFTLDTIGPRITRHSPAGDVAGTVEYVAVWLSEAINRNTFTIDDISITGPAGPITPTALSEVGLNAYRISFAAQTEYGSYHVLIGPQVGDIAGNPTDQDRDGVQAEEPDDVYDASFNLVDVDLTISNVQVSSTPLWAGEPVTVSWDGANDSGMPLLGDWTDAVYFSADDQWDIDDVQVTTVPHTGGLAQDETYHQSVDVVIPGALPGDYYVIVRADLYDQEKEGGDEGNNVVALGPLPLDVQELPTDGSLVQGTLSGSDRTEYFAVFVGRDEHLHITLDALDDVGRNEVYVRYGQPPTRSSYDVRYGGGLAPDQECHVPSTQAGVYYVMVYADAVTGTPAQVTVAAALLDFRLFAAEPSVGGNTGTVTTRLTGAKLIRETAVHLRAPDGATIEGSVLLGGPGEMFATFDLNGAEPGAYDVLAIQPGAPDAVLPGALTVVTGTAPDLRVTIDGPSRVRARQLATLWVNYSNAGNVDLPVPVVVVSADNVRFKLLEEDTFHDGSVRVLAINTNGPGDLLPPGSTGSIRLNFRSDGGGTIDMTASLLTDTDQAFDWDALAEHGVPPGSTQEEWAAVVAVAQGRMGKSWQSVLDVLREEVTPTGLWADAAVNFDTFLAYVVAVYGRDAQQTVPTVPAGLPYGPGALCSLAEHCEANTGTQPTEFDPNTVKVKPVGSKVENPSRSFVITHGNLGTEPGDRFHQLAGEIKARYPDANVYIVDWSEGADHLNPRLSAPNIDSAGKAAYALLRDKIDPASSTFIGESFGNYVNNHIAREFGQVDRIMAFNPAHESGGYGTPDLRENSNESWSFHTHSPFDTQRTIARRKLLLEWPEEYGLFSQHTYGAEWLLGRLKAGDKSWLDFEKTIPDAPDPSYDGRARRDGSLDPSAPAPTILERYPYLDAYSFGVLVGKDIVRVIQSFDPNDKLSPTGSGSGCFVHGNEELLYTVRFENMATASAPAIKIVITDVLAEDLDLGTFELTEIGFGGNVVSIPEGVSHYATALDMVVDNEYVTGGQIRVQIDASLDMDTRELRLEMMGLDPATGWLPEDVFLGILYPNDEMGRGDGYISYTVKPEAGLPTGTEITNKASIVFDWNDPIETPLVLNTIDADEPVSSAVGPLSAVRPLAGFEVSWSGEDAAGGSGVGYYDVYVSDNGGPYELWLKNASEASATYTGENFHTYGFYCVAIDNVGHVQDRPEPATPDAVTTVALILGDTNGDGEVGIADLAAFADNYGRTDALWRHGDFNGDRLVGIADLAALADNYGRTVGGQAAAIGQAGESVPEEPVQREAVWEAAAMSMPAPGGAQVGASEGAAADPACNGVSSPDVTGIWTAVASLSPVMDEQRVVPTGEQAEAATGYARDVADLLAEPDLRVLPAILS